MKTVLGDALQTSFTSSPETNLANKKSKIKNTKKESPAGPRRNSPLNARQTLSFLNLFRWPVQPCHKKKCSGTHLLFFFYRATCCEARPHLACATVRRSCAMCERLCVIARCNALVTSDAPFASRSCTVSILPLRHAWYSAAFNVDAPLAIK